MVEDSTKAARNDTIKLFWTIYRQATKLRISGNTDLAIDRYEKALQFNPDHEDALYYLGGLYLEQGKYIKAQDKWLKLEKINPQRSRIHFRLGNLYLNPSVPKLLDIDKAEKEFELTVDLNREDSEPILQLGSVQLIRGNLESAQKQLKDVIQSNFKSVPGYFLLGFTYWKQNKQKAALESFTSAAKYSKPHAVKTKVVGEGDTKSGKVLKQSIGQRYFDSSLADLDTLNPSDYFSIMNYRYRKLDSLIVSLRSADN